MRFKTKQDVISYLNENKDVFEGHDYNSFLSGAIWMFDMKSEEVEALKSKNKKLTDKVMEYSSKLMDYDMMFFGYDTPKGKKSKKTKDEQDIQSFETQEDIMIEDEDNDESYYD